MVFEHLFPLKRVCKIKVSPVEFEPLLGLGECSIRSERSSPTRFIERVGTTILSRVLAQGIPVLSMPHYNGRTQQPPCSIQFT